VYAVVKVKGFQFRVEPDALVRVPRLGVDPGAEVPLEEILLVADGEAAEIGNPVVAGARVVAEVVRHGRGPKTQALKYKRRKDYRRHWGFRQDFTELRIRTIEGAKDSKQGKSTEDRKSHGT
jgi:large subunit ribosomal protein L21